MPKNTIKVRPLDVMNIYCDRPITRDPIPLLWLCGPPGVGKSTVGWQFYSELTRDGIRIGYLDIDQLGMCYPAPVSDPERHQIKARNLGAMVATFHAAGAQGILVSGVVDEIIGVRNYIDQIPQTTPTLCQLRVDHDALTERLLRRGIEPHQVDAMLCESNTQDHSNFADVYIDTSGLTVSEVIRCLREKTHNWPALTAYASNNQTLTMPPPKGHTTPGSILWLCGATAVGKSTVGWQIFEEIRRAGITAAFVDLEQIGFCQPVPEDDPNNHHIKAHNLAAMWQTFHASGAQCLIVVGPVDHPDTVQIYTNALQETTLTLCRLHAGVEQLRHRIMRRGQGFGPRIAGDALNGKPTAILQQIAEKAAATAEVLQRNAIGDLYIDTNDLTVEEVAQTILEQVNRWP
ncbi:MAG: adenylylsulfate kinase-like enzyme/chloramphenicol 3-O-phosphotransferase [Candidatus Latescibacterota bacterium]|jgi:adenylylsulfate kinase-like enzyme/chloramphenicol 3-O-phosphotransferase